jgi:hypothetical protein
VTQLLTPAKDGRLQWRRTSTFVWQLLGVDGGTAGTIVLMPIRQRYSASTHRSYLGQFADEQSARHAVENAVERECN